MRVIAAGEDETLATARIAVRYVVRGWRPRGVREDALSDALFGIAQARRTHNPFLGSWRSYSFARAVSAVRDGERNRAPLSRRQYAASGRDITQLLPQQRTPVSLEAHRADHPTWDVGAPDALLEHIETRDHVQHLLGLVDGRYREVLIRHYLMEQPPSCSSPTTGESPSPASATSRQRR